MIPLVKIITVKDLKKAKKVTLIDVREPFEYAESSIEGATLIPLGDITCAKLPTQKGKIVIHCRSGKRSEEACRKLLSENPDLDVFSLEGGILAWKESGEPTQTQVCRILPIDRQTQVVAGSLVFFGTVLGVLISPSFYILPGFVGAGLIFAGLSGWCGMAKLLAHMPWNKK